MVRALISLRDMQLAAGVAVATVATLVWCMSEAAPTIDLSATASSDSLFEFVDAASSQAELPKREKPSTSGIGRPGDGDGVGGIGRSGSHDPGAGDNGGNNNASSDTGGGGTDAGSGPGGDSGGRGIGGGEEGAGCCKDTFDGGDGKTEPGASGSPGRDAGERRPAVRD